MESEERRKGTNQDIEEGKRGLKWRRNRAKLRKHIRQERKREKWRVRR